MSRTVTCTQCERDWTTPSDTGRHPLRCPTCAPTHANKNRAEIITLRAHIEQLEADLAAATNGRLRRRSEVAPASRHTLAIAVRRVGYAEGARGTAQALRELAAEALAWAHVVHESAA